MSRHVLTKTFKRDRCEFVWRPRYGYYRNRVVNVEVLTAILPRGNRNEPNDLLLPLR